MLTFPLIGQSFCCAAPRAMRADGIYSQRRKDGSEFLVEIGLNPIHTPEGTLVLTEIVDITERKRMNSSFRGIARNWPT